MSSYSLTSDSRRWWWPSAAAGVVTAALIGVVVVSPATGHDAPVAPRQAPPAAVFPEHSAGDDRPCFMVRPRWNVALDGPRPTCGEPSWPRDPDPGGVPRAGLSYLP